MSRLKLTESRAGKNGRIAVLHLAGMLGPDDRKALADTFQKLADEGIRRVVLDLKKMEHFSSAGIGLLVFRGIPGKINQR